MNDSDSRSPENSPARLAAAQSWPPPCPGASRASASCMLRSAVASPPSPACLENRVQGKAKWVLNSGSFFLSSRFCGVAASCASGVPFSCRLAISCASGPFVQARESSFGPRALPEISLAHSTPTQCPWAGSNPPADFVNRRWGQVDGARQNNQGAHTTSSFSSLHYLSAAAACSAREGLDFLAVHGGPEAFLSRRAPKR